MSDNSCEPNPPPSKLRLYLTAMPLFFSIVQLIFVLNFSGGELLPPGSALSFNYGWPLQFYKQSQKSAGGVEFQFKSILGDAAVGGLMLYAIWRIAEYKIKHRVLLGGSESFKDSKVPRFGLITWFVMIQVLAILLYLNVTPGHSPFLMNADDKRIGWPVPLVSFNFGPNIPSRINVTGLFANLLFTYLILYATWWSSEKLIELRK